LAVNLCLPVCVSALISDEARSSTKSVKLNNN
jgi:hypothetical protein